MTSPEPFHDNTSTAPVHSWAPAPTIDHSCAIDDSEYPHASSSPEHSSDDGTTLQRPRRPKLSSRKSSGTMIIPRDSPRCELKPEEEEYDEHDVRSMSPRRSSEDIEKLGADARNSLIEQAKMLQASLMAIVDRVETVKVEHEKLEGGNKFLQSYIGELIQTSKITSAGPAKGKKGRTVK